MLKWYRGCFVAAILGLVLTGPVQAWFCCRQPCQEAVCYVEQVITCYRQEYQTEYREVKSTVYRCVPVTTEKEISETFLVPHVREVERQRTIMVPVTHEETRERTILQTEWRGVS